MPKIYSTTIQSLALTIITKTADQLTTGGEISNFNGSNPILSYLQITSSESYEGRTL